METRHATTTTSNAIPTPEIEMDAKAAAEGTVESAASLKQEIVAPKIDYSKATDGTGLIQWDPWLEPYAPVLRRRYASFQAKKREIEGVEGSLYNFAGGYKKFGFNRTKNSIVYREWAPAAKAAYLIGDFNEWKIGAHPMTKDNFGVFSIELPDIDGKPQIPHNSKVKISLVSQNNERMDRIPAWIKYAVQPKGEISFVGVYWEPEEKFVPKHTRPPRPVDLRIYEAHVGMSSSEPKIATYKEFERDMLPYIKDLGYNAIQLMAIMEHVYYASFGYHVTNFFACSSRFGTPEDLKSLIDTAHGLGLVVLIDVVHSHASKNVLDGLNHFDGTDHQYFHGGGRGYHDLWDSRLFNYNHWEVSRFLLSNLRWWVEEYGFDGFRFDGVTSMLYFHHGMGKAFGSYDDYFGGDVDEEAVVYLMLANDMLHNAFPFVISIAEDVSGMPGLGRPVAEGGIGFDYRLAMAIPDKWIEILKKYKDEDWNMGNIVHTLVNRRYKEAAIAYAESHDQALVGDKTIAFWLMDKEMYDFMSVLSPLTPIIERGIALHKMIRLITFGLGGEGYLNFMGNESGHPEWIDFPREGNNNSFHHCRRRWDVLRDPLLRYKFLTMFDKRMMALEDKYKWLVSNHQYVSNQNEADKVIVFERGPLVFAFNFHPTKSFADYRIGVPTKDTYRVVLNSDNADFGGHSRIDEMVHYTPEDYPHAGRPYSMMVYIPNRTAVVYGPLDPQDAIEGRTEIVNLCV